MAGAAWAALEELARRGNSEDEWGAAFVANKAPRVVLVLEGADARETVDWSNPRELIHALDPSIRIRKALRKELAARAAGKPGESPAVLALKTNSKKPAQAVWIETQPRGWPANLDWPPPLLSALPDHVLLESRYILLDQALKYLLAIAASVDLKARITAPWVAPEEAPRRDTPNSYLEGLQGSTDTRVLGASKKTAAPKATPMYRTALALRGDVYVGSTLKDAGVSPEQIEASMRELFDQGEAGFRIEAKKQQLDQLNKYAQDFAERLLAREKGTTEAKRITEIEFRRRARLLNDYRTQLWEALYLSNPKWPLAIHQRVRDSEDITTQVGRLLDAELRSAMSFIDKEMLELIDAALKRRYEQDDGDAYPKPRSKEEPDPAFDESVLSRRLMSAEQGAAFRSLYGFRDHLALRLENWERSADIIMRNEYENKIATQLRSQVARLAATGDDWRTPWTASLGGAREDSWRDRALGWLSEPSRMMLRALSRIAAKLKRLPASVAPLEEGGADKAVDPRFLANGRTLYKRMILMRDELLRVAVRGSDERASLIARIDTIFGAHLEYVALNLDANSGEALQWTRAWRGSLSPPEQAALLGVAGFPHAGDDDRAILEWFKPPPSSIYYSPGAPPDPLAYNGTPVPLPRSEGRLTWLNWMMPPFVGMDVDMINGIAVSGESGDDPEELASADGGDGYNMEDLEDATESLAEEDLENLAVPNKIINDALNRLQTLPLYRSVAFYEAFRVYRDKLRVAIAKKLKAPRKRIETMARTVDQALAEATGSAMVIDGKAAVPLKSGDKKAIKELNKSFKELLYPKGK